MADTGVARFLEPAVPAVPALAATASPVRRSAPADVRRVHAAAVALATALDDEERERAALDAGLAVGDLAVDGRADDLRSVLTPEPSNANVTWTVCCYQVGDLAPSGMHDFADPLAAVDCLVDCPDASHIAGELIASTRSGLCWTALTRTNERLRLQLPGPSTLHDTGDGQVGAAALAAWDDRLGRWLGGDVEPEVDLDVDGGDVQVAPPTPEVAPTAGPEGWSWLVDRLVSAEVAAAVNERRLVERLEAVERRLERIERRGGA